MKIMKKYYIVYCRKSSETEDRQMQSIDDQMKILRDLIDKRNLSVLNYFTESKSAKQPYVRPEFQKMTELIQKRKDIKGIVCWHLNRLSRNPVDSALIQWFLQNGEIEEIVTPTRIYLEVDSDLIMAIEGAMANKFIRDLRRDTMRGTMAKISKGIAPIKAPVGYLNNSYMPQGQRDISPHPEYFPLVKKVFSLALTGHFSISQLVKQAKDLGIRNTSDRPISKTRMYEILKDPFYTGQFKYNDTIYDGVHTPMLSQEEYDLIQDIYNFSSRGRYSKHQFPLTNLIRCPCEGWITAEEHIKLSGKKYTYYKCSRKGKGCNSEMVASDILEKQVISFLSGIQLKPHYIEWFIRWLNVQSKGKNEIRDSQIKTMDNRINNIQLQLDNLLQLKISPKNIDGSLIDDTTYETKRKELLNEKVNLKSQLSRVDAHFDEFDELTVRTFNFASRATVKFTTGSILERKTVVRAVGSNLVLKGRMLDIQPRTPFKRIYDRIMAVKRIELTNGLSDGANPLIHSVLYPVGDSNP